MHARIQPNSELSISKKCFFLVTTRKSTMRLFSAHEPEQTLYPGRKQKKRRPAQTTVSRAKCVWKHGTEPPRTPQTHPLTPQKPPRAVLCVPPNSQCRLYLYVRSRVSNRKKNTHMIKQADPPSFRTVDACDATWYCCAPPILSSLSFSTPSLLKNRNIHHGQPPRATMATPQPRMVEGTQQLTAHEHLVPNDLSAPTTHALPRKQSEKNKRCPHGQSPLRPGKNLNNGVSLNKCDVNSTSTDANKLRRPIGKQCGAVQP